jgi:hypothetical protein
VGFIREFHGVTNEKIQEFFESVPYSKAKFLTVHLVKEIDLIASALKNSSMK